MGPCSYRGVPAPHHKHPTLGTGEFQGVAQAVSPESCHGTRMGVVLQGGSIKLLGEGLS